MIIETKFNIGEYPFYGDGNTCQQGKIVDIEITFILEHVYIFYKIDMKFGAPDKVKYRMSEDERYVKISEKMLYSSPKELLEKQIDTKKQKIDNLNNNIEDLRQKIKDLDNGYYN